MAHVGLLLALAIGVLPVEEQAAPGSIRADGTAVEARPVPQSVLAFQDDPGFRYDRERVQGPGLLDRLLDWVWSTLLDPLFGRVPPVLASVVLYGLLAVILGSALYHVLRSTGGGAVARTIRADLDCVLREDGIEAVNLESWLERALQEGRNRDAVRLHYLIALQMLTAHGALAWAPEKTNSNYVRELGGRPVQELFARFTRMFDVIWYGSGAAGPAEVDRARAFVGEIRSDMTVNPASR
jgi:hypothetical protein